MIGLIFFTIFLGGARALLTVCLYSDIVSAELFNCVAILPTLSSKEAIITVNDIFAELVVIVFVLYPLVQLLLVVSVYVVLPEQPMLSIVNTMVTLEFIQIVAEGIPLTSVIFERRYPRPAEIKDLLQNKEIYINVFITIVLGTADYRVLNLVHCFVVYYLCEALTKTTPFIRAYIKISGKEFISSKNFEVIRILETRIWAANRILQGAILVKLVFTGDADWKAWMYISSIPIILNNI